MDLANPIHLNIDMQNHQDYNTWFPKLNDYCAFNYELKIPFSSEDYSQHLPEFLETFLTAGYETGMYIVPTASTDYAQFIQRWKANLEEELQTTGPVELRLINFQHAPAPLLPFPAQTEVPNGENWNIFPPQNEEAHGDGILEVESLYPIPLKMGHTEYYWYEYLELDLSSHSNIWLKEIEINYYPGFRRPIYLDLEVDNSAVARKLLPRFNSFLNRLRKLAEKLGGTMELTETVYGDFVTPEGILYDGKLLFD